MKFQKHIEQLTASLQNPAALSPKEIQQIISLLGRLKDFEQIRMRAKINKEKKMAELSGKIMHLKRISAISHALYWGEGDESKNWERLIKHIESYNRSPNTKTPIPVGDDLI